MSPHKIRPYKSHTHERDEFFDSVNVPHVRVLYIESGGFHDLEKSLNLPSVLVCLYGMFRIVVANENLKFRLSVGVLKPRTGQIYIFTFHHIRLMEKKFFTESDAVEQMPCANFLTGLRIYNPKILPDPYVACNPFLADKFPVCHETIDTSRTENVDKPLYNSLAFHPIGVPRLSKSLNNSRKAISL